MFSFKHAAILDEVNRYFLLTGQQITRSLYPKDKDGHYTSKLGNASTVRSRLAFLTEHKYLSAHHLPTAEGQRPYGYSLALRGKHYEEEQGNVVPLYWEKNQIANRSPGWKMHLLELNDFLITTSLLPVFDPALTITTRTHDLLLKRTPYHALDAHGTRYTLQPDAIVELQQKRAGRNSLRYVIWVEMDRGTNDNQKFRSHLSHIYHYIDQGYAERDFGTANLTVLFPTTAGDRRVDQMRALARLEFGENVRETQRRNQLFLFAAVPPLMQPQPAPRTVYCTPFWYTAYGQERNVQIVETPD